MQHLIATSAVSKLFNPLNRIPHNSTNQQKRCCHKHTWCS